MNQKRVKVLIAASGTGGHIFPAIHVAKAILKLSPQSEITFVGTGRPLEQKLIGGAGFNLRTVGITGLSGRGLMGAFKFLIKLPSALYKTFNLIRGVTPDLVFGFGGYGSFLPVTVARILGIPTWIHEAEASPGLANRVLGWYVDRISTAFPGTDFPKRKVSNYGHPVRAELLAVPKERVLSSPAKVLVVGGSQGARALDNGIIELAPKLAGLNIEITHQTRPENLELVEGALKKAGVRCRVLNFIEDMAQAYADSDVIIARSGAGTVAEIAVVNRPTIFVPLPSSQGGHQMVNAQVLASRGKAIIIAEGDGFSERLLAGLIEALDPQRYRAMVAAPGPNQPVDAAMKIAEESLGIIGIK
jgi:UDP-N-acetylglucosamine--N-acetylmuramyl-(pentapeptide) pyrophosphoryl-undecaprenol N-acetylglucosamine transferase